LEKIVKYGNNVVVQQVSRYRSDLALVPKLLLCWRIEYFDLTIGHADADGEGGKMPTTLLRAPSSGSDSAELSLRAAEDGEIIHIPSWRLTPSLMAETGPFRKFRWYKGQRHYSGITDDLLGTISADKKVVVVEGSAWQGHAHKRNPLG
jgi:hypothetical protein